MYLTIMDPASRKQRIWDFKADVKWHERKYLKLWIPERKTEVSRTERPTSNFSRDKNSKESGIEEILLVKRSFVTSN